MCSHARYEILIELILDVKDKKAIAARFSPYKHLVFDVNERSIRFPSYFTHLHLDEFAMVA